MSQDNFRDLYSSHREGTLEAGPASALDERLQNDFDLREDYDAFVATCDSLDLGAKEEIAVPDWLSARVLDRLETLPALQAERRSWLPVGLNFRSLGFAGLGAVALLGAAFAVIRNRDGDVVEAGLVAITGDVPPSAGDVLRPVMENGRVYVDLQSTNARSVSILAGPDGAVLKRFAVEGRRLHTELANRQPDPYVFEVRVDREARPLLIVMPGTDGFRRDATGTGDLTLFAKALARTYKVPIALRVNAPKTAVTWNLTGNQAHSEALRTLDGLGLSVDAMPGGLLSIQDR